MLPHAPLSQDYDIFDIFHKTLSQAVDSKTRLCMPPDLSHVKKEKDDQSSIVPILRDCEMFDCVHRGIFQTLDSKTTVYMPPESHVMIERHGQSATVHIRPVTEVLPRVEVEESVFSASETVSKRFLEDNYFDGFSSDCKRFRTMKSAVKQTSWPSAASSTKHAELEKLERMIRTSSQMPTEMVPDHHPPFSTLDGPSPLGLTLRKTPSLVDLVQMKLAQTDVAIPQNSDTRISEMANKERKTSGSLTTQQDKLKASNFPASVLRIGMWECVSKYEGNLVAKCYFAKKKLVWEILENGLKSKIEVQWSDISALKASCLNTEPGVLEIEVSQPPLFFEETNPQPRKHTLWQATSDFTGEQASVCKWHYLKFPPGTLDRHYEKLIRCDARLKLLSESSSLSWDSDHFEQHGKFVLEQDDGKKLHQQDDNLHIVKFDSDRLKSYSSFPNVLGSDLQPIRTVTTHKRRELDDRMSEITTGSHSISSGLDSQGYENSSHTNSREVFNTADSPQPEYADHWKATNQIRNQLLESIHIQRSSLCPLVAIEDANRQILNGLANHLIEEPSLSAFDQKIQSSQLNLLSSLEMNKKDIYRPNFLTSGLLSQAWSAGSLSFQDHLRSGDKELNRNMGPMAFRGRRLLSESSFGPNLCSVGCEPSGYLLFNIPHITSLPELYEPALQGLNRCPELPTFVDTK